MIDVEVHFASYSVAFPLHSLSTIADIYRETALGEAGVIAICDASGKTWVFNPALITHISAKEVTPE